MSIKGLLREALGVSSDGGRCGDGGEGRWALQALISLGRFCGALPCGGDALRSELVSEVPENKRNSCSTNSPLRALGTGLRPCIQDLTLSRPPPCALGGGLSPASPAQGTQLPASGFPAKHLGFAPNSPHSIICRTRWALESPSVPTGAAILPCLRSTPPPAATLAPCSLSSACPSEFIPSVTCPQFTGSFTPHGE